MNVMCRLRLRRLKRFRKEPGQKHVPPIVVGQDHNRHAWLTDQTGQGLLKDKRAYFLIEGHISHELLLHQFLITVCIEDTLLCTLHRTFLDCNRSFGFISLFGLER